MCLLDNDHPGLMTGLRHNPVDAGLYSYGPYSYGPYSYGLYSYGPRDGLVGWRVAGINAVQPTVHLVAQDLP